MVREVLILDQLSEFVTKHHTRDLFRLETLSFYNAASDEDDFHRYLRSEPVPTRRGASMIRGKLELFGSE